MKAGAAGIAPQITVDDLGVLRLNLDVGVQSTDGAHARVLGHVALPEGAATTLEGWGVKRLGIDPGGSGS